MTASGVTVEELRSELKMRSPLKMKFDMPSYPPRVQYYERNEYGQVINIQKCTWYDDCRFCNLSGS